MADMRDDLAPSTLRGQQLRRTFAREHVIARAVIRQRASTVVAIIGAQVMAIRAVSDLLPATPPAAPGARVVTRVQSGLLVAEPPVDG